MSGRCTLGWMTLLTLLVPSLSHAQEAAPPGYFQSVVPHAVGGGHPGYGVPPTGPGPGPGNYYEEIPGDTGWLYDESPLERFLVNAFRHSYFRAEYLLFNMRDPGNVTLAEPSALNGPDSGQLDPNQPQFVVDPNTGNILSGLLPTLNAIQLNQNNGVRGTFGFELRDGALEASVFALQASSAAFDGTPFINGTSPFFDPTSGLSFFEHVVYQPVLQEGAATGFPLIYDISYRAQLKTNVWGSELNWLWNDPNPNDNFDIRPLFGIRYFNYKESLRQRGDYTYIDQLAGSTEILQRRIDAVTDNYMYGPQFGFRAEVTSKWFDIGATPRVMLGLNSYKATLNTSQVLSPTEPNVYHKSAKTSFGPIADLQAYTRLKLHENFSILVSYNLMWAGLISRPSDNIIYNTSITPQGSLFQQNVRMTDTFLQGISVGGELRF
jgi:hypothetical protein